MRGFQRVLDADEEGDGLFAIDEAVVVAEGEVHHRADDDLAVEGDGALLDGVHAEDAALRRVKDGRAEERAVGAAVGNGEHAALQILDGDLAFLAFFGVVEDVLLDAGEGFLVAIAQHRDDEAFLGADGDADVVEVVLDDIRAIDAAVDGWHVFERLGDGFDEKGHEAELHAVLFQEILLHAFPELHDGGHIDLVEGGEDGGGLLGIDEMGRDLAAQHRHLFPCGAAFGDGRGGFFRRGGGGNDSEIGYGARGRGGDDSRSGCCRLRSGCCGLRSGGGRCGGAGGDCRDHLADGDFLAFGGEDMESAGNRGFEVVGDLIGFEGNEDFAFLDAVAILLAPSGDVRGGDGFAGGGHFDLDGCAGNGWRRGRSCGSGSFCGRCRCGGGLCGSGFEFPDHRADRHFLALADGDGEDAVGLGLEFVGNLVGLKAYERLAFFDRVAVAFIPFGDVCGGDGFAGGGHFDVDGHDGRGVGVESDFESFGEQGFLLAVMHGL